MQYSKNHDILFLKLIAKQNMPDHKVGTYSDLEFVQSVTAQIPWTHNKSILDKVKDKEQMTWYILKTAENSWLVDIRASNKIWSIPAPSYS